MDIFIGATGQRQRESSNINKSLTVLGRTITALSKGSKHIPYRDSKITYLLKDSLGGNCKTTLLLCCSPAVYNRTETINAMRFGQSCKLVKNRAKVNKVQTNDELIGIINKLKNKVEVLEQQNDLLKDNHSNNVKSLNDKLKKLKTEHERLKTQVKSMDKLSINIDADDVEYSRSSFSLNSTEEGLLLNFGPKKNNDNNDRNNREQNKLKKFIKASTIHLFENERKALSDENELTKQMKYLKASTTRAKLNFTLNEFSRTEHSRTGMNVHLCVVAVVL